MNPFWKVIFRYWLMMMMSKGHHMLSGRGITVVVSGGAGTTAVAIGAIGGTITVIKIGNMAQIATIAINNKHHHHHGIVAIISPMVILGPIATILVVAVAGKVKFRIDQIRYRHPPLILHHPLPQGRCLL